MSQQLLSFFIQDPIQNPPISATLKQSLISQSVEDASKRKFKQNPSSSDHNLTVVNNVIAGGIISNQPITDLKIGEIVYKMAEAALNLGSKFDKQKGFYIFKGSTTRNAPPLASLHSQSSLIMLWKMLRMFETMDDPDFIMEFYGEFLKTLKNLQPLSLSNKWWTLSNSNNNKQRNNGNDSMSIPSVVAVPAPENSEEAVPIMQIPELLYLQSESTDPDSEFSGEHDPLGIVQKLFNSAEYLANTVAISDRAVVLTVCLVLALKSGRTPLLIRTLHLLFLEENRHIKLSFDTNWITDIENMQSQRDLELASNAAFISGSETLNSSVKSTGTFNFINIYFIQVSLFLFLFTGLNTECDMNDDERSGWLMSFGKSDHGKLGHGDSHNHILIPSFIEHFQGIKITQVASMSTYSLAVDTAGVTYIWGTGGSPSSAHGNKIEYLPMILEALPPHLPVLELSCGLGHALFLVKGSRVFAWGNGGNGRLGIGSTSDRADAVPVSDLDGCDIMKVCCGASHSLALSRSSKLFAWGRNAQGQCGRGGSEDILRPIINTSLKDEILIQVFLIFEYSNYIFD